MSNFINVEKEKMQKIIKGLIDKENYLGLNQDRSRLVGLGVALGINEPKNLASRLSLSRGEYIKNNAELEAIVTCATVMHMDKTGDLNEQLSDDSIFKCADECLNTGLDIIEDNIINKPMNNYKLKLLEELDELYEDYINNI